MPRRLSFAPTAALAACLIATVPGGVHAMPAMPAAQQWVLTTSDTRLTVAVAGDALSIVGLRVPRSSHEWLPAAAPVPLLGHVWVGGKAVAAHWRFDKATRSPKSGALTLAFTCAEPALVLRSVWRARPGHGPVEHWVEVENRSSGPVAVGAQDSLALEGLRPGATAEVWWIRRGGSNASTEGGTFREPAGPNLALNLVSNCEDGSSPVPWAALQVGEQRGLYVGWEFSGLGRVEAKAAHADGDVDLRVGVLADFKTDIAPGATLTYPAAFVGCYTGDIDEGSYRLHRFIIGKLRPPMPPNVPDPTLAYNLYLDAGGASAREADVLRSARFCKEIGFETFMPDAMWFPATGDWRWDPARFPNGVIPVERYVHENGMHLALWCAWTNGGVSEHPDALSVRGPVGHPDWFSGDFGANWQPGPFYGGQLCLGCDEAKAWEIKKTQWLVGDHGLDYLKHDCGPIVSNCNKTTHRHHYGVDASYWATLGYYEVQEKLRRAHPNVILENCSGGGHIKDFGIIQRTHYTVTTDTLSNLPDRQSIWDSTFAFPPLLLQAYTYDNVYPVKGDEPRPFLWRSAMMSAWQIDPTDTAKWTQEEKDLARRSAEIYKTWIRPMLTDVKVHHVLPRPDGHHWDGLFEWSPSMRQGMLFVFRPDAPEPTQTVRLAGLAAGARYWVWSEDGSVEVGERSGAQLMRQGLPVALPSRYTSDLIYVRDGALGKPEGLVRPGRFSLQKAEPASDYFGASVKLTWTLSQHARAYRITLADATQPDKPPIVVQSIDTFAAIAGLAAGYTYRWSVEAASGGGRQANDGGAAEFATPPAKPLEGVTFVSDMKWVRSSAGADNPVRRDVSLAGRLVSVGGKPYPKGIWTHAFNDATPADVAIDIAGAGYATFVATAGLDDASGGGSVQFQVLMDGKIAAETAVLKPGQVHPFRVDVTSAREIVLRVLNGGDGYVCDHAVWAMARLVRAGADDPWR